MLDLYGQWKDEPSLAVHLKQELVEIDGNYHEIEDRFYQHLSFGTGGMRGLLGAGTNRMNIYTIRRIAEGLALLILADGKEAMRRGVVIAYDTRHFSKEFALETAKTIGKHGIQVFLFKESRPTPELSFAIRHLHAYAGVVITASHNPATYNGIKIYGEDGGQLPPIPSDKMTQFIETLQNPFAIRTGDAAELVASGQLIYVSEEIDAAYERCLLTLREDIPMLTTHGQDVTIVFTPLHGAGLVPVTNGLRAFGFDNVTVVQEQAAPNSAFPTVLYPNPEERSAFELAIALGHETKADLLLATDPDADRLGVAIRKRDGEYELLNGNQLGALLLHYILMQKQKKGELPTNGIALKTIVTSEFGRAVATKFGVQMLDTLTGFKFISEKIEEFATTKAYTFLFGYEESYGFLIGDFARDKDAVQTALMTAEMVTYYHSKNHAIYEALQDLYEELGHFRESLTSLTFEGKQGQQKIEQLMRTFRTHPPQSIAGISVIAIEDYQLRTRRFSSGVVEPLTLPEADVLKLLLEDDSWICIRPSGTEPKCKFYFGVRKDDAASAEATLQMIEQDIMESIQVLN